MTRAWQIRLSYPTTMPNGRASTETANVIVLADTVQRAIEVVMERRGPKTSIQAIERRGSEVYVDGVFYDGTGVA